MNIKYVAEISAPDEFQLSRAVFHLCVVFVWIVSHITVFTRKLSQWSSWWRRCLGHSKNFCDYGDDDSIVLVQNCQYIRRAKVTLKQNANSQEQLMISVLVVLNSLW